MRVAQFVCTSVVGFSIVVGSATGLLSEEAEPDMSETLLPMFQERFADQNPDICKGSDRGNLYVRLQSGSVHAFPRDWVFSVSSQADVERHFPSMDWVLLPTHGCSHAPLPTQGITLKIPEVPFLPPFHSDDQPQLSITSMALDRIDALLTRTQSASEWRAGETYSTAFDPEGPERLVGCNSTGIAWGPMRTEVLADGLFVCSNVETRHRLGLAPAVYKASSEVYPEYFETGYPFVFRCYGPWRTNVCMSAGVVEAGSSTFYSYRIPQNLEYSESRVEQPLEYEAEIATVPDARQRLAMARYDRTNGRPAPLAEAHILPFDRWVRAFLVSSQVSAK